MNITQFELLATVELKRAGLYDHGWRVELITKGRHNRCAFEPSVSCWAKRITVYPLWVEKRSKPVVMGHFIGQCLQEAQRDIARRNTTGEWSYDQLRGIRVWRVGVEIFTRQDYIFKHINPMTQQVEVRQPQENSEELPLLAAILDANESQDDLPILVYCDWLDEHDFQLAAMDIRHRLMLARHVPPVEKPKENTDEGLPVNAESIE